MTTVVVSTTAQLEAALQTAASGDTIALAAGTYSGVSIWNLHTGGNVTVASVDPSNPATVTDLSVGRSSGITFSHLAFSAATDPAGAGGGALTFPFLVDGSSAINFDNLTVSGSPAGSLATTVSGLYIRNSSNCAVTNSSFSYLQNALSDLHDSGVTIANNTFADIYGDGIDTGGTSNVTITANAFTNMYIDPVNPQHPDCIQFWTTDTTASASNISVTNNTYSRGASGNAVQFIFITDQIGNLPYQAVTVTGNVATGALYNAIYIDHANGVAVEHNIVTAYPDRLSMIYLADTNNAQLSNNVAPYYLTANNTNTTVSGDIINATVNFGGASNPYSSTVTGPGSQIAAAGVAGYDGATPGAGGGWGFVGGAAVADTEIAGKTSNLSSGRGGQGGAGGSGADGAIDRVTGLYTGAGGAGGVGGAGGAATATAVTTTRTLGHDTASATAVGGDAGQSGAGGAGSTLGGGASGAQGGGATSTASVVNTLGPAAASASATGGAGGGAVQAGYWGGSGGVATVTAKAAGLTQASASIRATGGAGGSGVAGAAGGSGAASTLSNAVSGVAAGGTVTLSQTAVGGAGGSSDTGTGGAGGAAYSTLSLTDGATPSAVLNVTLQAVGGAGGGGGVAGAAGAALASGNVTGQNTVVIDAIATGAAGGGANATAVGAGRTVTADAAAAVQTATSGTVTALATADSTASVGASIAATASDAIVGAIVTLASATAADSAGGAGYAVAGASNAAAPFASTTWQTSVAELTALPTAASFASVLAANTAIGAAMGAGATALAMGELGGGHSNGVTGSQTESSRFAIAIDTGKLDPTRRLELGLYGGAVTGSGVTSVTLDVDVGGSISSIRPSPPPPPWPASTTRPSTSAQWARRAR